MADGFLFGSCSECCRERECDCFNTPPLGRVAVGTTPAGLVTIEFEACFGEGAAGTVEAPQATNPCDYAEAGGAIQSVTLTSGGSGYAILGRVQPTISATAAGGSGATFSVSLSSELEYAAASGCVDVPYWVVDSVSVTAAGNGYSDGAEVTFSAASGDTTIESAAGRAYVEIEEPDETFSISSNGSGAVLEAVWDELPSGDWADVRTPNPCPALPKKTYRLTSVNVIDGGSGYSQFDIISITFTSPADGAVSVAAFIDVDSVDGNGAITAVFVAPDDGNFNPGPAGRYVGSETDRLESVVVNSCVANGQGHYYREDSAEPPYVAPVAAVINQLPPSNGSGGSLTAVVDDDPNSGTFGQIVSVTVDEGGSGYFQPSLCNVPENLFISWGGETIEVPLNAPITDSRLICGEIEESTTGGLGNDGNCRFTEPGVPGFPEDLGYTRSLALFVAELVGGESLVGGQHIGFCACDKQIHVIVRYNAICQECVPGIFPGVPIRNSYRTNFQWIKRLCFRFELDEDGCPVGDGVLVSSLYDGQDQELGEYLPFLGGDPASLSIACGWYENDDYTSPGPRLEPVQVGEAILRQQMSPDDCPCDRNCFELPGLPTVSFMPP